MRHDIILDVFIPGYDVSAAMCYRYLLIL